MREEEGKIVVKIAGSGEDLAIELNGEIRRKKIKEKILKILIILLAIVLVVSFTCWLKEIN